MVIVGNLMINVRYFSGEVAYFSTCRCINGLQRTKKVTDEEEKEKRLSEVQLGRAKLKNRPRFLFSISFL